MKCCLMIRVVFLAVFSFLISSCNAFFHPFTVGEFLVIAMQDCVGEPKMVHSFTSWGVSLNLETNTLFSQLVEREVKKKRKQTKGARVALLFL